MMILLIPSYSIEDFSVDRIDAEANQILSAWTALYHPALIEKANRLPAWERASNPGENECELMVVPPCCEHLPPPGWLRGKKDKCVVIRNESDREIIVQEALKALQLEEHGFEDWFVDAFFAVGTHFVLSELLTRQQRYMSMLDEYQLKERALDAIKAYRKGDADEARSFLQQMFEQLQQSREYFYPMTAYLIDLVLTAPTTLGEKLFETLGENRQVNLVMPLSSLRHVTREYGELAERMRHEIAESRLELAGDPLEDVPLSHLVMPDLVERLMRGTEAYRDAVGAKPVAYMRKQADFVSALPSLLQRAGYKGAILYTTEGWKTPEKRHSLLRWGSPDGRKIGAVTRYPNDANSSETFLQLPRNLGRMLDGDYAPTVTLAHYPKHSQRWLNDLFVAQQYAPVFGRFHSLSGFFKATKYTGQTQPLDESIYLKSRRLVEAIEKKRPNPVSAWGDYHRMMQRCTQITTLAALAAAVVGKKSDLSAQALAEARAFLETFDAAKRQHDRQLYGEIDADHAPVDLSGFAAEADRVISRLSCYLGAVLTGTPAAEIVEQNADMPPQSRQEGLGYLLLNPSPHSRNMLVDVSDLPALPTVRAGSGLVSDNGDSVAKDSAAQTHSSPVLMARANASRKEALVEVPPFGYAWVGCDADATEAAKSREQQTQTAVLTETSRKAIAKKVFGLFAGKKETGPPPLVDKIEDEGYYLRNEFFELRVDETTGAVASLFYYNKRGNRLAQQLGFRFPEAVRKTDTRLAKDGNAGYTIMAADKIETVADGPLHASLRITGRLMHFDGSVVATFEQTITVSRGSKIVRFDVTIDPQTPPGDSPWDSYYAMRFAWGNMGYEPYVGITSGRHECLTKYVEAPYFVDLRDETQSLTVFGNGLPYHRRTSDTRLDTILIANGEGRRSFRIDVGVDVPNPTLVAQELMTPHTPLVIRAKKPKIPTAWLFSFDAKSVVMQKCEPLFDEMRQPSIPPANVVNDETVASDTPANQAASDEASAGDASGHNAMSEPGYGYDGIYAPDYQPPEEQANVEATQETRNSLDDGWCFPDLVDSLRDEGRPLSGLRLWLLETEGLRTELSVRSFRPIHTARVVDFELNEEKTLTVSGDRVTIPSAPHEFLPVEIRFA